MESNQFKSLLEKQFWKDEFKEILKINVEKKFGHTIKDLNSQEKLQLLLDSQNTRHRYYLKRKFSPEPNRETNEMEGKKTEEGEVKGEGNTNGNGSKEKEKEKGKSKGTRRVRSPGFKGTVKRRRGKTEGVRSRLVKAKSQKKMSTKNLRIRAKVGRKSVNRFSTPKLGEIKSAAELLSRKQSKVKIKTSIAQQNKRGKLSSLKAGMTCSTKASSQALLVHSLQRKWSRLSRSKDAKGKSRHLSKYIKLSKTQYIPHIIRYLIHI